MNKYDKKMQAFMKRQPKRITQDKIKQSMYPVIGFMNPVTNSPVSKEKVRLIRGFDTWYDLHQLKGVLKELWEDCINEMIESERITEKIKED